MANTDTVQCSGRNPHWSGLFPKCHTRILLTSYAIKICIITQNETYFHKASRPLAGRNLTCISHSDLQLFRRDIAYICLCADHSYQVSVCQFCCCIRKVDKFLLVPLGFHSNYPNRRHIWNLSKIWLGNCIRTISNISMVMS